MRYNYTDKEIKSLLKSISILVDTDEKENSHVIKFFEKKKLLIKNKSLNFGDYSFYLPKNEELGINRDIFFDKLLTIERKNSLSELAGNLGNDRNRFVQELIRKKDSKMHLMVEDGSWAKINNSDYQGAYRKNSYLATLYTFMSRYDLNVNFVAKELAGQFIYSTFYYYAREYLSNFFQIAIEEETGQEESFRGF